VYAAVSIAASGECCSAVKELLGKKTLVAKAPRLPLADCTMPTQCQCRFTKKAPDRRDGEEERRFHSGSARSVWYAGQERRKSLGRRGHD
jgi:hypothetical protein